MIYLSPNQVLDANGVLINRTPLAAGAPTDNTHEAPPNYNAHQLDQLYSDTGDIAAGWRTPAVQSGMNTPFYAQSQANSRENLASLSRIAASGDITAGELSSRLEAIQADLDGHGPSRQNSLPGESSSSGLRRGFGSSASISDLLNNNNHHTPQRHPSQPQSARISEEQLFAHLGAAGFTPSGIMSGRNSPEHIDMVGYMNDLSKVPSYNAATRGSNAGGGGLPRVMSTQELASLPTYEAAVTAPPSPQSRPVTIPNTAQPSRAGSTASSSTSLVEDDISPNGGLGLSESPMEMGMRTSVSGGASNPNSTSTTAVEAVEQGMRLTSVSTSRDRDSMRRTVSGHSTVISTEQRRVQLMQLRGGGH